MPPSLKTAVRRILHPFRRPVTWACQHGVLSSRVRGYLPWRWSLEPFTVYGSGWRCVWQATEFDAIGHQVFWAGLRGWEKESAPVILENIRRARCFIDIGANCGLYTVLGCTVSSNVKVVAVEPVPKTCAALRRNVEANRFGGRVTIVNAALGESNGTVAFHEAEDATMSSLATSGYQGQRGTVIEVACLTLDSLVAELGVEPDFLKIDVEGFEHVVLSGASKVLSRFRPRMVLEANPGDRSDRVTEILTDYGYGFEILTERGPESRPAIVPEHRYRNWLCQAA